MSTLSGPSNRPSQYRSYSSETNVSDAIRYLLSSTILYKDIINIIAGDVENKEVKVAEAEAMAYSLRCAHVTVSNSNVITLTL